MTKKPTIQDLQQQVNDLTEALKRERADSVNLRRRQEEQIEQLKGYVKEDVINQLLPVIDDIDLAFSHAIPDPQDPWAKGMRGIKEKLLRTLENMGLEIIRSKGEEFNPELHEAIEVSGDGNHEMVTEVLRRGYKLDGRVIRHAMVKVKKENK